VIFPRHTRLGSGCFFRATTPDAFAIADDIPLSVEAFLEIGRGKAYDRWCNCEERLKTRSQLSQQEAMGWISNYHDVQARTFASAGFQQFGT
jgi:hypothetical protein